MILPNRQGTKNARRSQLREGTTMLKALSDFLRNNKERIVRTHTVLTEDWNPTYGLGDPCSVDIEVIDFDALCSAIDDFSAMFKE